MLHSTFHWCRTVFFLIPTISAYTIVLGSLSLLASLLPGQRGNVAHRCARAWSWLILATTGVSVRVRGLERLTPGATYVFVSNHQSLYDIPVVFWSLPYQLRIIAKESLGKFPFLGWHLRRSGHMLVDRRNPDRAGILRQAGALARAGVSLIVFPEGTRSADGMLGRFKGGSFLLAIEAGLPIVPVIVLDTRRVMRKGELTVRPAHLELVIHEPLSRRTGGTRPVAEAKRLADEVRRVIDRTLAEAGR